MPKRPALPRSCLLACALVVGLAARPCFAQDPDVAHPADATAVTTTIVTSTRVSSAVVGLRFALLGKQVQVGLAPLSTVVIKTPEHGSPEVIVECGHAIVSNRDGKIPVLLGANRGSITVTRGVACYSHDAVSGQEWGMLMEGVAQAEKGGAPFTPEELVPFRATDNKMSDLEEAVLFGEGVRERLTTRMAKILSSSDDTVSELPTTIPAGPTPFDRMVHVDLHTYWPVTGGGMEITVPRINAAPTQYSDALTSYRNHIVVSVPGEGMGGGGFMLELSSSKPGRVVNFLWTGGTAFVRFPITANWSATLAPRSVVTIEAKAGSNIPDKVHLDAGALLLEGSTAHTGAAGPAQVTGGVESSAKSAAPNRGIFESESFLYAVPEPDDDDNGAIALVRARAYFEPLGLLSLARARITAPRPNFNSKDPRANKGTPQPGPASNGRQSDAYGALRDTRAVCFTLLADMPMSAGSVARFLPLHVAGGRRVTSVELSMMGSKVAETPGVGLFGVYAAGSSLLPDSLMLPLTMAHSAGPSPETYTVYISSADADLHTLMRSAKLVAKPYESKNNSKFDWAANSSTIGWYFMVFFIPGLLLLNFGSTAERRSNFLRMLTGLGFTHCPRCDLILDFYPIGEFDLKKSQEMPLEILRYDMLTEASVQQRNRLQILDWLRANPRIGEVPKFRFQGSWCQRCMQGAIRVEVLAKSWVVDESDWIVFGADTLRLLELMQHPEQAAAAEKDARAKRKG